MRELNWLDEMEARDKAYKAGSNPWGAGPSAHVRLLMACPTGCNRMLLEADNGMECPVHGHFTWAQLSDADTDD